MGKPVEPIKNDGEEFDTSEALKGTLQAFVEGITGLATSDRKTLLLSFGHIVQRMRGGSFLKELMREWENYREKGRVKDDYSDTEQHKECLQELLDFLDQPSPDRMRFEAMKKVFLVAATEEHSERHDVQPQQFMKLLRDISSGELMVLFAAFRTKSSENKSASIWLQGIALESGLSYLELVELHEEELIKKHLLTPRMHSDRSGIRLGVRNRLTSLGNALCEFIELYETEDDS